MTEQTAVVNLERQPRSVLVDMSTRYGMEPAAFEATVRATVCKGQVSREEFAAFLLVAKEYRLNPLTKEIYAFPAKGGGIQPIVSIDGWARIINERPELDGIEFDDMIVDGELFAVTCKIHRKDRSMPVCVTEYLSECKRATDVWKQWPARMLRHKALIQCARYAFGFSGIVDPDEFERMESVRDVTPRRGPDLAARLAAPADDHPAEGFTAVNSEPAEHASPLGDDDIPTFDAEEVGASEGQGAEAPAGDDDGFPGDR
ncbi:phage recombination protein Bet [Brevundimonas viscosa]|uniref:Phage recombination protein Bet n=1 Tax=Brevundimonas viscosa TaxID=871741 RepID=A0A1I6PRM8_9CAUL|nr:phage recombination protein Bet [Brevundimonas viscosa]SFS42874.1 phage recombination protein Bet [Brevundimonas viscosa]